MPPLIVSATAKPLKMNGADPVFFILVSVMMPDGQPVLNLKKSSFTVRHLQTTTISQSDSHDVTFSSKKTIPTIDEQADGFYLLQYGHIEGQLFDTPGKAEQHLFIVMVSLREPSGRSTVLFQGQAIATAHLVP